MFIQTEDLVKAYKERNAVNGVSIRVDQGQIVGLLGPNGAGKTTTFYMIVGIERPTSGQITIDGKDITQLPIHKRAAYGIGYLPQEASIFRKLTVEDNLLAMLETTKLSKKEQHEKAEALMEPLLSSATAWASSFPVANGAVSKSPAVWSWTRLSSSSMNPLPASTPWRSMISRASSAI